MTPDSPIFALTKDAAVRGGAKAGQYLQSINQTDLAKLNVAQFNLFCETLVFEAWRAGLDDYIARVEAHPPF